MLPSMVDAGEFKVQQCSTFAKNKTERKLAKQTYTLGIIRILRSHESVCVNVTVGYVCVNREMDVFVWV